MKMVLTNNCSRPLTFNSFRVEAKETVVVDFTLIKGDRKIRDSIRAKEASMYVTSAPKVSGSVNRFRLITQAELNPGKRVVLAVDKIAADKAAADKAKKDAADKANKADTDKAAADKAAADKAAADKAKKAAADKAAADKAAADKAAAGKVAAGKTTADKVEKGKEPAKRNRSKKTPEDPSLL